jgi:hypothetical protein
MLHIYCNELYKLRFLDIILYLHFRFLNKKMFSKILQENYKNEKSIYESISFPKGNILKKNCNEKQKNQYRKLI